MEAWLPDYCFNPDRPHTTEAVVIHFISCINVQPSNPLDPQSNWWLLHDLNCELKSRMMFPMPEMPTRAYASYHSVIDRDGLLRLLVPIDKYAYHAGVSEFKGRKNWNDFAYGVALLGHGKSKFTDAQYETLARLCKSATKQYQFSADWIVGHEEIAPGRKVDPGIASGNFDMVRLRRMISNA